MELSFIFLSMGLIFYLESQEGTELGVYQDHFTIQQKDLIYIPFLILKGSSLLCDDLEGWDGGREALEGRDVYVIMTNLCCCTAEINITL